MSLRRLTVLGATAVLSVGLTACGSPTDTASSASTSSGASGSASCTKDSMKTLTAGKLTIGTDKPAYGPWFADDDPSNGKGYESAVAYAIADKLGYAKGDVVWVVAPFSTVIAPGAKNFDFDVNRDRKSVV